MSAPAPKVRVVGRKVDGSHRIVAGTTSDGGSERCALPLTTLAPVITQGDGSVAHVPTEQDGVSTCSTGDGVADEGTANW